MGQVEKPPITVIEPEAGPVVAGVVGQERYQFDIWGDTVNVAARMVGMNAPGSVVATKETWDKISSGFDGESLGELHVKGKGEISVYGIRAKSGAGTQRIESEGPHEVGY